jgi:hypothetical protein
VVHEPVRVEAVHGRQEDQALNIVAAALALMRFKISVEKVSSNPTISVPTLDPRG